jgi:P-type Cu+ transporter
LAHQPTEDTLTVTDPVCGMTIEAAQAATMKEYKGKTYYFCSESCARRFEEAPAKYVKT